MHMYIYMKYKLIYAYLYRLGHVPISIRNHLIHTHTNKYICIIHICIFSHVKLYKIFT